MTTNAIINGQPGNMSTEVAKQIIASDDILIHQSSLTGKNMPEMTKVDGINIKLFSPNERQEFLERSASWGPFISVDYTHPSVIHQNCDFYCENGLPFVMGTTGGKRDIFGQENLGTLEQRVRDSNTVAVIAPNMAKQIVAFQSMMQYAAKTFPKVFQGYSLRIWESHQAGKADTSGTAKTMLTYFNQMGIPFTKDQINMERDAERQWRLHNIPMENLEGHGWHTYTLESKEGDVLFEFKHNVNGRGVYAAGTLDAIRFLDKKIKAGEKGKVYSMIDVLKETD